MLDTSINDEGRKYNAGMFSTYTGWCFSITALALFFSNSPGFSVVRCGIRRMMSAGTIITEKN